MCQGVVAGSKRRRARESEHPGWQLKEGTLLGVGVTVVPVRVGGKGEYEGEIEAEFEGEYDEGTSSDSSSSVWSVSEPAFLAATDGSPWNGESSYDAVDHIWGWVDCPLARTTDEFDEVEVERAASDDFCKGIRECGSGSGGRACLFLLRDGKTEKVFGVVELKNDDPECLKVEVSR